MKIDFNTKILDELLNQNAQKSSLINERFPKIHDWQKETRRPTFNELVKLSKYFGIPLGYFFLDKLPVKKYPIPHYRSTQKVGFKPSSELLETIYTVEQRQQWGRDILTELTDPLLFAGSFTTKSKITTTVENLREVLGLPESWSKKENFKTWNEAFRFLIRKVEDAGIFVVVNGVVNNNTSKKLDVQEFRGFVLYDNYAPFIFINGNDFVSAKIFTLIHEVVHILIGESASFDYDNLIPAHNEIEEFCDAVTAEFLVPEKQLLSEIQRVGIDFQVLANQFKVSKIVIARRLLDLRIVNKPQFIRSYNSFKTQKSEISLFGSKGGNFYNTAPYRISRSFFNLVYSAVKSQKMLYRDAFRITGLTPKSFDGYVKEHLTK